MGTGTITVEKHSPFPPSFGLTAAAALFCPPSQPPASLCAQPLLPGSQHTSAVCGAIPRLTGFCYIWVTCISGGRVYFHSFRNGNRGWLEIMFSETEDNWIDFDT